MNNSILNIGLIIILLSVTSCHSDLKDSKTINNSKMDSINHWVSQVENTSLNIIKREILLRKAYKLNQNVKNDSIRRYNLINISRVSSSQVDSKLFNKFNKEAFDVSKKANDTLGLAKTHYYYGFNYYYDLELYDSAYFHFNKAKNYNELLGRSEMVGWNLYEMASLLIDVKNYTGSEILIFEALEIFKNDNNTQGLAGCYSLLAHIYGNLEEYDQSLFYDKKVLELLKVIERQKSLSKDQITEQKLIYRSNIASTYFYKKDYRTALNYYLETFRNKELKNLNAKLYYRLIHNINYTKFKIGDTIGVLKNLNNALYYRDSLNDITGVIDSKLDLAQFHAYFKDTITALKYTLESKILALSINKNKYYLKSLKLLSNFDKENAKRYLEEYIVLNDSLQKQERKIRNKFTRIQFETKEQIEKADKLSHQKILITGFGAGIIVILILLYFIRIQRSKNHKLQFEKEQQKSNEEIYNLILEQQSLTEEGRFKERQRIAEELHDGIIGKIFGTRMNLSFLNFIGSPKDELKYKSLIQELQDIEKEVRMISHELKNEELESQHNFSSIINILAKKQSYIGKFIYKIHTDEEIIWNEIEGSIKINIYRILQESLQNCYKHAEASEVQINFKKNKKSLLLIINDNGKGFDVKQHKNGIGLTNLKSRVNTMNGSLVIKSSTKSGTQIEVNIPNVFNSTKRSFK